METGGIAIIAAGVLLYALVSKRLEGSVISLPIVFVVFGWLIGGGGFGLVHLDLDHGVVHVIAEVTLVLVLFADATRIDLKRLIADHNLPQRTLLAGLPLIILAGGFLAMIMFPAMSWAAAFLLAAILAPTDAALGQSVVSNPIVPVRIRQALNVESGLNDGIVLPVVLIFAICAGAPASGSSGTVDLAVFALKQVGLGPLAGIAVGAFGAFAINRADRRGWMTQPFEGVAILAVAAMAYVSAELIGGNGFIGAFVGGMIFGARLREKCVFLLEFMETEGQLLTLMTFLIFGAAMVPEVAQAVTWTIVLYALLSLTAVRMVPIALSISGTGLSVASNLFLGWFGPRGLASILFVLLILERYPVPGAETVYVTVVLTVLMSVALHGVTAGPFARAYGRLVEMSGECAETEPASEMPVRHRMSLNLPSDGKEPR
jgi:NhaP-type Na+/H+ or K+/H+ antiporter